MSYLQVDRLSFRYLKAKEDVINCFCMQMEKGEIVSLIGDSGSGKSTILRLLAGLETPISGAITLDDNKLFADKINLQPEKRNVGMIFQDYALFPHLTVLGNVQFAIESGNRKEKKEKAMKLLQMVEMEEHANKRPHQCSGGQQQRIAIARAMATEPKLLLLDEPFSNLDARLRSSVRCEITNIIKRMGISAILVTHDKEDVEACADRAIEIQATSCKRAKRAAEPMYC
ncbi:MAG: ABC transporter ATP-binding protein [Defluviitaleaceae bacterium]|nr:ABC transporter ATP-binding protein [Defluviitaleaceae bacterium]